MVLLVDNGKEIRVPPRVLEFEGNQVLNLDGKLIYLEFYPETSSATQHQSFELKEVEPEVESEQGRSDLLVWTDSMTKLLIQEYRKYKPMVENGRIKTLQRMWKKIEDVFRSYKYEVSSSQIESKWKSLERAYKKTIDNKNKTGRARKECSYKT